MTDDRVPPPTEPFARLSLRGARFQYGALPVESLVELQRYRDLVLEAAFEAWARDNPGVEPPPEMRDGFDLTMIRVDDGSAVPVFDLLATEGYYQYYEAGKSSIDGALFEFADQAAAFEGVPTTTPVDLPTEFDQSRLPGFVYSSTFLAFGSSLHSGESLALGGREERVRVITPELRSNVIVPVLEVHDELYSESPAARRNVVGVLVGRVTALDADQQKFTFVTTRDEAVRGRYRDAELTADFRAVLDSRFDATVVRLKGRYRYSGTDIKLIASVDSIEAFATEHSPWSARLITLASLASGWDGDDAPVLAYDALDAARDLLNDTTIGVENPSIFAGQTGGVRVEWMLNDGFASVEIDPSPASGGSPSFAFEKFSAGDLESRDFTSFIELREFIQGALS